MFSSFPQSAAIELLSEFKFGETAVGLAFNCCDKTLAWFSLVFISTAVAWLVLANGMLLVPVSITSCPPFVKAPVLSLLTCKILCFSTCVQKWNRYKSEKNGYRHP